MKTIHPAAQVALYLLFPGLTPIAGTATVVRVAYAGFCLAMMLAKKSQTEMEAEPETELESLSA
jgi:hypothetical protein